ncbi:MAG TPA: cytochrome c [Oleiagrimonas sp.]|nr:cytochrome c [Oleiagrimonas sp.]
MTRSLLLAVLSAALIFGMGSAHAQDSGQAQSQKTLTPNKKAGRTFVYTCAGCHGITGYQNIYPTYHVPLIAGQNADYIEKALHEYRTGIRKHPTMGAQAEGMTDQDIVNIAAYLSSLAQPFNDKTKKDKAAKKTVASAAPADKAESDVLPGVRKSVVCQACHGKYGIATAPQYPDLAGQYADYIVQVLHEYKDGQRKNSIMKGFVSQLSDKDMKQIAAYFARQPTPLDDLEGHIQGDD